jgi:D-cysteine desulfhydrase
VRKLEFLMADAVAQGADCVINNLEESKAIIAVQLLWLLKYLNLDCFLILRTSKVNYFLF